MAQNMRSKDFRYVFVNSIGVQFNGAELMLRLGVKEDIADTSDAFFEEMAIVMSPNFAKLLGITLSRTIEAAEKASGQTVPVDEAKLKFIDAAIASADRGVVAPAAEPAPPPVEPSVPTS